MPPPPRSTLFPYTTLFRSGGDERVERRGREADARRDRVECAGRVEGRAARRHELPGAEGNSGYASLRGHGGGRCATVASVLPAATVSRRPVRLERRAGRVAGLAI